MEHSYGISQFGAPACEGSSLSRHTRSTKGSKQLQVLSSKHFSLVKTNCLQRDERYNPSLNLLDGSATHQGSPCVLKQLACHFTQLLGLQMKIPLEQVSSDPAVLGTHLH